LTWVGGDSPPARRRAARWDGWVPQLTIDGRNGNFLLSTEELAARIRGLGRDGAFDVVFGGYSDGPDDPRPASVAAAGATWWLECWSDMRGPTGALFDRLRSGPASG
jgi:hypothetical protein